LKGSIKKMSKTILAAVVMLLMSVTVYGESEVFRKTLAEAERGDDGAQFNIGLMYHFGRGVAKDYKEAANWYRKAAEQGYAEAQLALSLMCCLGEGVTQDYKQAVKWCRKAAEQGLAEAQCLLGLMYHKGRGVPQDNKEALKWYSKAAQQGNALAQYHLASMYDFGEGIQQDDKEAVKWYTKAAEQGNLDAQCLLGAKYLFDLDVPQEAVKWLAKAAEHGHAGSQFLLGLMYSDGEGVPHNDEEAVKWYAKAAEQGHSTAQCNLGLMYHDGKGVRQDYKEAVKWFRKAAEQGNALAQSNLGSMYYQGEGVLEDYIESYKWLILSAAQANEKAINAKNHLKDLMSSYQIAEAQRLAKAFVPKPEITGDKEDLRAYDSITPKLIGTGFFIRSDGYIITAAHVVKDATKIKVLTHEGVLTAKLHTKLVNEDVAVLKVDVKGYSALPIKSSRGIKFGAEVFTVGFPNIGLQGFEPKFTKGNISSLAGIQDDPKHFQISVPIQPGNSGGVDERGNVIGVVVAKLSEKTTMELTGSLPQNVNYALKSSFVLALLESVGDISNEMPDLHTKNKLSFENIVDKVRNSVVLILAY
jgi:TPR repeat protein